MTSNEVADDLLVLEHKLKQLKLEYDQYLLGSRPREPILTRGEVQKLVGRYSNMGIQNTALRFKFNTLCARFFAMRRQWDEALRKIETGTYERHAFKARLHEREREGGPAAGAARGAAAVQESGGAGDLFEAYVAARRACGEDTRSLTRERLDGLVAQQRSSIQARYGCDDVRFRVVVEAGKAKLKATPVKSAARSS